MRENDERAFRNLDEQTRRQVKNEVKNWSC